MHEVKATNDNPPVSGGCQCGAVRYAIAGAPLALYACHCRECRKQSGSAFGLSLQVRRDDLRLTAGEPRVWERPTDSGGRLACWFCPACGSRLWHEPVPGRGTATVKAGSLDADIDMAGAIHIWTSRALPGVAIPSDAQTWPEEPPP